MNKVFYHTVKEYIRKQQIYLSRIYRKTTDLLLIIKLDLHNTVYQAYKMVRTQVSFRYWWDCQINVQEIYNYWKQLLAVSLYITVPDVSIHGQLHLDASCGGYLYCEWCWALFCLLTLYILWILYTICYIFILPLNRMH